MAEWLHLPCSWRSTHSVENSEVLPCIWLPPESPAAQGHTLSFSGLWFCGHCPFLICHLSAVTWLWGQRHSNCQETQSLVCTCPGQGAHSRPSRWLGRLPTWRFSEMTSSWIEELVKYKSYKCKFEAILYNYQTKAIVQNLFTSMKHLNWVRYIIP